MSRRKKLPTTLPVKSKIEDWGMLFPLLNAVLKELQVLSKSKPNDALNSFKVKSINKILEKIKKVLSDEPTTEFLDLIDEETIPSNSDALFMTVQFKSAMEQFKAKYFTYDSLDWDWRTSD